MFEYQAVNYVEEMGRALKKRLWNSERWVSAGFFCAYLQDYTV